MSEKCPKNERCFFLKCPLKHSKKACFNKDKCTRKGCRFRHPRDLLPPTNPKQVVKQQPERRKNERYLETEVSRSQASPPVQKKVTTKLDEQGRKKTKPKKSKLSRSQASPPVQQKVTTKLDEQGRKKTKPKKVLQIGDCPLRHTCSYFQCSLRHPPSRFIPCRFHNPPLPEQKCHMLHHNTPVFLNLLKAYRTTPQLKGPYSKLNKHIRKLMFHRKEMVDLVHDISTDSEILHAKRKYVDELDAQLQQYYNVCSPILQKDKVSLARLFRESRRLRPKELKTGNNGEVYSQVQAALPCLAMRQQIIETVKGSIVSIIVGETGSGKSTQIPQYLAEERCDNRKILCTQPRAIATISLADRVNSEFDTDSGNPVGCIVDDRDNVRRGTHIEFMTESVLVSMLVAKGGMRRILEEYSVIVVDEAHERNIETDLILGRLKQELRRQKAQRNLQLRLVVASATIVVEEYLSFFGDMATPLKLPGREFPIDIKHKETPVETTMEEVMKHLITLHQDTIMDYGDILVFVSSVEEVEFLMEKFTIRLNKENIDDILCLSLHENQRFHQQRKIYQYSDYRKVIFSTSVAETSLTIPSVKCVIDCGKTSLTFYDIQRNLNVTRVVNISKSSAMQRAGRAGRTCAGYCFRFYSKQQFLELEDNTVPQIMRNELSTTLLAISAMNIAIRDFCWLTIPLPLGVTAAKQSLRFVEALEANEQLTALGRFIAEYQVPPMIGRLIWKSMQNNTADLAVLVGAICLVGTPPWYNQKQSKTKLGRKKIKARMTEIHKRLNVDIGRGDIAVTAQLVMLWLHATDVLNQLSSGAAINIQRSSLSSKRNQKKFCSEFGLSHWTLSEIEFKYNELCTKFHIEVPMYKIQRVDTSEITDMIASSFYLNLTKRKSGCRVTCLQQGSSAILSEISYSRRISPNVQYLIYQSLQKNAQTELFGVTPIGRDCNIPDTVKEEFWQTVESHNRLVFTQVASPAVIQLMCGNNAENLPRLEERIEGVVELDHKSRTITVEVFGDQKLQYAITYLKSLILEYEHQLQTERYESIILGNTRAIIGPGGMVDFLELGNEKSVVVITGIPLEYEIDQVKSVLRSCDCPLSSILHMRMCPGAVTHAVVLVCQSPTDAAKIMKEVDGLTIKNGSISCQLVDNDSKYAASRDQVRVTLFCPRGTHSQCATIVFTSEVAASRAVENCNLIQKDKMFASYHDSTVYLYEVPTHVNEVTLWQRFRVIGTIVSVSVERNPSPTQSNPQDLLSTVFERRQIPGELLDHASLCSKYTYTCTNGIQEAVAIMEKVNAYSTSKPLTTFFRSLLSNGTNPCLFYGQVPFSIGLVSATVMADRRLSDSLATSLRQIKNRFEAKGVSMARSFRTNLLIISLSCKFDLTCPDNFKSLQQAKEHLNSLFQPRIFEHPNVQALFTPYSQEKIQTINQTVQGGYIAMNEINQSVCVFATDESFEVIKGHLWSILHNFNAFMKFKLFYPKSKMKLVGKQLEMIRKRKHIHDVQFSPQDYSLVLLVGDKNTVSQLIQSTRKQLQLSLKEPRKVSRKSQREANSSVPECPICYDDAEDPVLLVCGHSYCKICFLQKMNPQDASALLFPITCDTPQCGKQLTWYDISQNVELPALRVFILRSYKKYLDANRGHFVHCFAPDCKQIFRVSSSSMNCDQCVVEYCRPCCRATKKAIPIHPNKSCFSVREDFAQIDWKKLGVIQCPSCGSGVQKSDGCNHIHCKCGTHFCYKCGRKKIHQRRNCSCKTVWGGSVHCTYIYHHIDHCQGTK